MSADQTISFDPNTVTDAIVAELMDYFWDANVTGVKLGLWEAKMIAGHIVHRLCSDIPNRISPSVEEYR